MAGTPLWDTDLQPVTVIPMTLQSVTSSVRHLTEDTVMKKKYDYYTPVRNQVPVILTPTWIAWANHIDLKIVSMTPTVSVVWHQSDLSFAPSLRRCNKGRMDGLSHLPRMDSLTFSGWTAFKAVLYFIFSQIPRKGVLVAKVEDVYKSKASAHCTELIFPSHPSLLDRFATLAIVAVSKQAHLHDVIYARYHLSLTKTVSELVCEDETSFSKPKHSGSEDLMTDNKWQDQDWADYILADYKLGDNDLVTELVSEEASFFESAHHLARYTYRTFQSTLSKFLDQFEIDDSQAYLLTIQMMDAVIKAAQEPQDTGLQIYQADKKNVEDFLKAAEATAMVADWLQHITHELTEVDEVKQASESFKGTNAEFTKWWTHYQIALEISGKSTSEMIEALNSFNPPNELRALHERLLNIADDYDKTPKVWAPLEPGDGPKQDAPYRVLGSSEISGHLPN
ncbi:hypothetical protein TREMEDRAFT_59941 [Tremella mesenterica DSM 1558]|uniref:uncharacterized protein n=1 Tax=Tremella mesenterica (strain ATCC 24925 / CBS 8224 / DSM 1558 / NBRC 9311 / NRRL Y-6157 / RJB 2259-6 / UBC 559-6) TaxID=578456 RepID=UPI0003F4909A|nr:uncharacterized protein TREMEDRAFT_59941 [Tremella mesenterica DSM 1558]EIW70998.1 hypothetical protein TREMEDRAFT_59941 [Tremella mesenterica DSM 1558]